MIDVISTDDIKGALISYLKTCTNVVTLLTTLGTGAVEIREHQWKGDEFDYPCIRLRIIRNVPELGNCIKSQITFSWLVFTEAQSSATCDEISGIISTYFQTQSFSVSLSGYTYHFGFGGVSIVPAISYEGALTWRSEVIVEGFVSRTT